MITSLVFADAHVESDDVLRFEKLGKLIIDRKPQHIYDLGDTVSLSAISHWDMSKRLKMQHQHFLTKRFHHLQIVANKQITHLFLLL